ncbi:hypothetical protein FGG08_000256 [Glutinoglossum americanum]|uniref:ADF-H domain-containing protein n=1 Tax=Glutinoglossum americanum TaxID=1670608 RepID=A0A9P8L6Y5_9PEZI|nr:hypothetical protein FGG08_000256 [Glutinoglossum americanum]
MSLNGLDNPNVIEAYEAAAAEPGGWFLLKYVSRDEVELLGRGSSGVVEIRGIISQYTEESPLYGFIRYRRRSILIKYVPEMTSRLVQARVTVHFQAITERFSPYDTIFPISVPRELNDTSLSSACSLHTATGSTSSSNSSLRRRRLVEITEDAEEHLAAQPKNAPPAMASAAEERPQTAAGPGPIVKEDEMKSIRVIEPEDRGAMDVTASSSLSPRSAKRPRFESSLSPPHGHKTSPTADSIHIPHSRRNEDHRASTNSVRPSTRDLYSSYSYTSKPKIKLGPRPSLDTGGRPFTSGSASRQHEPRPVSTLPAGIRIPRKNSTRPRSQYSNPVARDVPPLPANLSASLSPMDPPTRPTTSPGISPATPPPPMPIKLPLKSPSMTPEKQKLMKALQLRKKQMSASPQEPVAADTASEKTETGQSHANGEPGATSQNETVSNVQETAMDTVIAESEGSLEQTLAGHVAELASIGSTSTRGSVDELSQSTKGSSISKGTQSTEMEAASSPAKQHALESLTCTDPTPASLVPMSNQTKDIDPSRRDGRLWLDIGAPGMEANGRRDVSTLTSLMPEAVPLPLAEEHEIVDLEGDSRRDETREPRTSVVYANDSALKEESGVGGVQDQHRVDVNSSWQAPVESICPDQEIDPSEDCFLSDDSFIDELDTVTVQEAKPILVTKSPVTKSPISPVFPPVSPALPNPIPDNRKARGNQSHITSRTVSNPVRLQKPPKPLISTTEIPVIETARSVSASFLSSARSSHAPTLSAKKVNVSSGISQRIKALELRSGRLSAPATPPLSSTAAPNSPGLPAARRPSIKSSNLTPDSKPNTPAGSVLTPSSSPSPSPEPLKIQTQTLPPPQQSITKATPHNQQKSRPESISVIARIIRDDSSLSGSDSKDNPPHELHQSPLIIEHQQGSSSPLSARAGSSTIERPSSVLSSSPSSRPNSSSPTLSRPASIVSKQSTGSRGRSEKRSSQQRRGSSASGNTTKEDKRESKKSRLLRRMSSLSSSSRKSFAHAISPTLKEEPPFEPEPVPEIVRPANLLEGWVNVQLPDTLVSLPLVLIVISSE